MIRKFTMLESNQSELKLDSQQKKFLIINPEGLLDAIVSSRVLQEDDLVLRRLEEGIFSVLKDGKHIVEQLNKLTSEHGYSIVLYSNRTEQQIVYNLRELEEACKIEDLKEFPKITAMMVKDRGVYPKVRESELKVADRPHGISVADYSSQSQQETDILYVCSKLFQFSKLDQNSYVIFDRRSSFVKKAQEEGWNAWDASLISLRIILYDLCQRAGGLKDLSQKPQTEEPIAREEKKGFPINSKSETQSATADSTASSPRSYGKRMGIFR